jgi:hypothetical protein
MRGAQQVHRARNVHALKIILIDPGFAKRGGEMHDAIDAAQRLSPRSVIEDITRENLRTQALQVHESGALIGAIAATQSHDVVSISECMFDEVTADESACTGNE